jgi:hypothetical protein
MDETLRNGFGIETAKSLAQQGPMSILPSVSRGSKRRVEFFAFFAGKKPGAKPGFSGYAMGGGSRVRPSG